MLNWRFNIILHRHLTFVVAMMRCCIAFAIVTYSIYIPAHRSASSHVYGMGLSALVGTAYDGDDHHHSGHSDRSKHHERHAPHFASEHTVDVTAAKRLSFAAIDLVFIPTYSAPPVTFGLVSTIVPESVNPLGGAPPTSVRSRAPPVA